MRQISFYPKIAILTLRCSLIRPCFRLRFFASASFLFQINSLISIATIMSNKWSEQFDLLDEPNPKKAKRDDPKKPRQSSNDYYDLQQDNKNLKLPTIAKNQPNTIDRNSKSTSNINLVELTKKTAANKKTEKEEQEEYEFQESLAQNPSAVKAKSPQNQRKKVEQPKQVQEESYGEQEFENEEKYQEDFQEHEEKVASPAPNKSKEMPKKPANVPKPAEKQRKGNSMAKKPDLNGKINSRNSIRSQSASRNGNSRTKAEQKKDDPPNKYTNLADKACANYERPALQALPTDKLVKENDKIRAMIKKFNDQLNDLINRNIMQLKNKKEEKIVPADDVVKNLQEQKNSNETVYQTTLKQLNRLKGKEGQLREEEYQLSLQEKIAETKTAMNEHTKVITKLKLQVNNQGNKLTKIDKEVPSTQEINTLKGSYMLIKKQEQKNDEILEKLYIKFEELTRKISEAQGRYSTQVEEAKQKGFSVQTNPEMTKRADQIKKKMDISKQHRLKTENLYKTKCEMLGHQCEQIRNQIKAMETSIQYCSINCQQTQNESKKIVEKARKNSKLSEDLVATLDSIIYQLQNGQQSREKDDHSTFSYPKGAKKYQSQKSVEKVVTQAQQVTTSRQEKQRPQDDMNLKKPTLFKKKEKQEEKAQERVWKDDKNNQTKKVEKQPLASTIPDLAKFQNKEEGEKKDQEKKKPFVIKKNKEPKPQEAEQVTQAVKEEPKVEKIEVKKQPENSEEVPSLAPRMMKFRRNKEEPSKVEEQKVAKVPQPKVEEKPVAQETDKPIFAPKRFQLRPKERNSEEGYVASVVEKKQEPKAVEEFKPKGITLDKQPITLSQPKNLLKIPEEKPTVIQAQQQKPKFNLRMRDRQRQSNKLQTKVQPQPEPIKEPQAKITITLNDKAKENNNQFNPYAAASSNEPPKREREGPLKKQKLATNGQKQNFNIYDQAEDITNVKEIKINQESPPIPQKQTEQPNLQDLLGLKKVVKAVDQDLIIDAKFSLAKGGKAQKKKDTNFFGDLQL